MTAEMSPLWKRHGRRVRSSIVNLVIIGQVDTVRWGFYQGALNNTNKSEKELF
jgi:hypothetical protein